MTGVGFAQNAFHRHDVYEHALKSLDRARGDAVLKLAVLLHDIGKPETAAGPPGEHTFYGHEQASAQMAEAVCQRLKFSNRDRQRIGHLIGQHMFHYEESWSDGAVRRLVRKVGPEYLEDLWEMRRADAWGRGPGLRATLANLKALKLRVAKVMAADAALKVTDLAVDGQDVMDTLHIPPGRQVGQLLDWLLEQVLDDPSLNERQKLLEMLRQAVGA